MNSNTNQTVFGIFIGAGLVGLSAGIVVSSIIITNHAAQWIPIAKDLLKQEAIQGCLEAGKEEYSGSFGGSKATLPNKEVFGKCMREKGYEAREFTE